MQKETRELVKQFEVEHKVRIDTRDQVSYWDVTVWTTQLVNTPRVWGRKYITTPDASEVLVVRSPQKSDVYTVEQWGKIDSFDDFVRKVMDRVREAPLYDDEECACQ
jgi:hypothetical protein